MKCPLTQHKNLLPKFITYKCLYYRGALNNRVRKVESKGKCTMLDSCHWVKMRDKKTHFQRFLRPGRIVIIAADLIISATAIQKIDRWCDQTAKVRNKSPQLDKKSSENIIYFLLAHVTCCCIVICNSLMVMDQQWTQKPIVFLSPRAQL